MKLLIKNWKTFFFMFASLTFLGCSADSSGLQVYDDSPVDELANTDTGILDTNPPDTNTDSDTDSDPNDDVDSDSDTDTDTDQPDVGDGGGNVDSGFPKDSGSIGGDTGIPPNPDSGGVGSDSGGMGGDSGGMLSDSGSGSDSGGILSDSGGIGGDSGGMGSDSGGAGSDSGLPSGTCALQGLNEDCVGVCFDDAYLVWLGDGYCDDGTWGLVFTCPEWNYDYGDCGPTP
jgi:hypothetical protein